jgi:hypothetical protein
MSCVSLAARLAVLIALTAAALPAAAHEGAGARRDLQPAKVPAELAVKRRLVPPAAGVTELKFADLFKLPVGPKGLEPTDKLRALDGRRVRIVGYMVQQAPPAAGGFLLSPLPVAAGDEDESLADDIPASAVYVTLPKGADTRVPMLPGLLKITGVLRVGAYEVRQAGRVAAARIELDARPERALLELARRGARQAAPR